MHQTTSFPFCGNPERKCNFFFWKTYSSDDLDEFKLYNILIYFPPYTLQNQMKGIIIVILPKKKYQSHNICYSTMEWEYLLQHFVVYNNLFL